MGKNVSGARIQVGSAFAGIGDTVAIGHVLYDSGFPIVPADNLWVLAREDPARFTVIPIGDIHISYLHRRDKPYPRYGNQFPADWYG
jgi:hypothetical protein